jgi:alkylation response protein AidB-like acyl-CoA dehydrogenase
MALNKKLIALQKSFSRFAGKEIAPRRDLGMLEDFPLELWRKMAAARLLGVGIPEAYGGRGGNYLSLLSAGESLVESGHNLGIALAWIIHTVAARFFLLGFGNEEQRRLYLPAIANGTFTASIAISEPDVGAHPARLQTSASLSNATYTLHGEKTWLTSGPIAGLFIVLAITGASSGRKDYSAFLVPKDTPGLHLTEKIRLDCLRPSTHCGIRLEGCKVPAASMLGQSGSAYERMAKPFRDLEDALLMGPAVGAMKAQLDMVITALKRNGASPSNDIKTELGGLESHLQAVRIIAYEVARVLDAGASEDVLLPPLLSLRPLAQGFQSRLERLVAGREDEELGGLTKDLLRIIGIAKNVALIKQKKVGEKLLSGKD